MTLAEKVAGNIPLYRWFKFCQSLLFWQATWFLYFQNTLSAAEAIVLYAVYDIGATALEVPSGYMSDRLGRRFTLIAATLAGIAGALLIATGDSFAAFALGQAFLGAATAFASGTDTALLYESLVVSGRKDEVEKQELVAWRFSFVALAISAVLGGVMALWLPGLPFAASAAAAAVMLLIAWRFVEPPQGDNAIVEGGELLRAGSLIASLREPVLIWLFVLAIGMYSFSHLPFVFGQPFIQEALEARGFAAEAPLVSGLVTATMMGMSILTSLVAYRLRLWLGLPAILLVAFAMQIGLCALLAATNSTIAIAFLLLRMVPNSLSGPFILARIQPVLRSESRATYLSLQSFCSHLIFAGTLFVASRSASGAGQMPYPEIQLILASYVVGGLIMLGGLGLAARRLPIETRS